MSKHTPGPWSLAPCSNGGMLVVRGGGAITHPQSHLQVFPVPDARLIAAAPELLELLQDMRSDIAHGTVGRWHPSKPDGQRMLAAIAKATGAA